MRLEGLIKPFIDSEKFAYIKRTIEDKNYPIQVSGLSGSSKAYFYNAIYEGLEKPIVIVTHSDLEAKNVYEDLSLYENNVYYFPVKEIVFYNIDAISGDLRWARLNVIKEILSKKKNIIVTSIEAFTNQCTPKELFLNHSINLRVGKELEFEKLFKLLIESGYERVERVEGKGEFSVRGGLLDVFPPNSTYPYRIELFGDEIESIRTFNTESQRSIEKVRTLSIFPAKEVIIDEKAKQYFSENVNKSLNEVLEKNKNKFLKEKLKNNINKNLEELQQSGKFETIESYMPLFYEEKESLFNYLEEYIFILDEKARAIGKLNSTYLEFSENYSIFLERGDILPEQGKLLIEKNEVIENFEERVAITLEEISKEGEFFRTLNKLEIQANELSGYQGQLDLLINDIIDKKNDGYKTIILSGTKVRGQRLVENLRERGIESVYRDKIEEILEGEVVITYGNSLKGFECKEYKICVISDKEVFGESKKRITRKKTKQKGVSKIRSFAELKPGDYVVHVNHGVGVYKGIKQIEVGGHKRDYLDIEYDKNDKLYVPVDQLDFVQKYIGSEGKAPKVNKLGGSEWQKAKAKVKKSINEIAEDLVKLYATRTAIKGHKFRKDTQWQRQFEDEFPFQETPDQLTSIEEIKKDMESDKVMDRLLCGDVGYGKTEVAMRAAFKAVMDGKQVAFLVPTTILAEQHYKTMRKRFSDFAINIDMISRFRTSKEQKVTLQKVKEGNVDILIGTHRLVSKDIEFKELGLLIVDEEQRFGVTQKEKIKNLKKNIDVLTLSATPIPRTLHMSLTGARDISVIETPPEERYPIQTYVVEENDQLIRDAIIREIARKGQVYFVYNRVEDIEKIANYVKELVPESRVTVVHGQMTERELEREMMNFMNKEYDVLVCTTIIETGIDIPSVNTIIVYNSDKMGLSQLYQLRGRVGRSNKIAYAYLLYTKDKMLTEVAEKRLKALKDFTELGSGFKIAMRDLEIRGAGNMMGSAQHGHMATIGYDLYCRMLEDTIKLIKGEIDKEPVETTIDLRIDAYIPSSYIKDEIQKIEIYKKIAAIENISEYIDVKEELIDRYSEIPESVYNLMDIAYIKSRAKLISIEEIKEINDEILFKFVKGYDGYKEIFHKLHLNYKKNVLLKFGEEVEFRFSTKNEKREELLQVLKAMFEKLLNE